MTRMLLISLLLLFMSLGNSCKDNPSSSSSNGGGGPTINSCSGDCQYFHIFDRNGNFVAEGLFGANYMGGIAQWDGKDYRGVNAPCGVYEIVHVVQNQGHRRKLTNQMVVLGENGISAVGESSCDSLRQNCTGSFDVFESYDMFDQSSQLGCLCCE